MLDILYEAKGVGLAAPQIGLNENIFVYNPSDSKSMERIVCNPTITKYSKEVIVEEEGCLSLRSDECAGKSALVSLYHMISCVRYEDPAIWILHLAFISHYLTAFEPHELT